MIIAGLVLLALGVLAYRLDWPPIVMGVPQPTLWHWAYDVIIFLGRCALGVGIIQCVLR